MRYSKKDSLRNEDIIPNGSTHSKWDINIHNKNNFELLIDYQVNPQAELSRFKLESYFFLPSDFRINQDTYDKKKFYNDMQAYIRFRTIFISLKKLINKNNLISPYTRVNNLIEKIHSGTFSQETVENTVHELKMLANMSTNIVTNEVRSVEKLLDNPTILSVQDSYNKIEMLIQDINAFNEAFLSKRREFTISLVPTEVQETYEFVLEYMSIKFQQQFTKLLCLVEQNLDKHSNFEEATHQIKDIIKKERRLRINAGYKSIIKKDEDNEDFARRLSTLTSFINNVLYLTARPKKARSWIKETILALTAGIAMTFALIFTFLAQEFQQFTLPFLILVVLSYVVRDRLKDYARWFFSQEILGRKILRLDEFDYNSNIFDQDKTVIGRSQENFKFLNPRNIPQDIRQLRSKFYKSQIESEAKPQTVFQYTKKITLFPQKITQSHSRVLDASDILRYDISSFLDKLENPYSEIQWFNIETDQIETFRTARVYNLNIINKFTTYDDKNQETTGYLDRVRIVLDKNGIKRIESDITS